MPRDHVTALAVQASHGQERLWFVDRAAPDAQPSLLVAGLELRGRLDSARFAEAVERVICRHEVLRTTLVRGEKGLLQVVHEAVPVAWRPVVALEGPRQGEATAARLLRLDRQAREWRPDLASGPLLRVTLAALEPDRWVLHMSIHHAVADAVTLKLLLHEVGAVYRGDQLPPPRLQYADVSAWQRQRIDRGDFEADRDYWRDRLRDLAVPVWDEDGASGPLPGQVSPAIGHDLGDALSRLAADRRTSGQCVLVAALGLAVCLDQGVSRVAVGIPVNGRSRPDLRHVFGFLVNTVAVPVSLEQQDTFRDVLGRVREEYAAALVHQELPFDEVVRALAPDRGWNSPPVFQVMVTTHTALLEGSISPA